VNASTTFDAIVVGSGAAGGWAAKELTERGLQVLLLEAGRDIDPATDFPVSPPGDSSMRMRLRGGLGGQDIQARCTSYSSLTREFFVDDRLNRYTTPRGKPFNWFRGRQLGGRLHTWARLAPRMSDHDFTSASREGFGVEWPIGYTDLEPYYDRVETFLGIDGDRDRLERVPDARTLRPIEPTAGEFALRAALAREWPGRPVLGARVIRHNPARIPKEITAANVTGRLVLRTGAVVERVVSDPKTGRANGVRFIDRVTKESTEAFAKVIFLCASTIETVRIMLNSSDDRYTGGLGASSGILGKYLMDHTMVGVGGSVPDDRYQPYPAGSDPYDFGRVLGFYIPPYEQSSGSGSGHSRQFHIQGGVGRGGPGWFMLAQGEALPYATNTVTLDARVKDAWGVPAAMISYEYGDHERQLIAAQREALDEICHIAGLEIRLPGGTGLLNRTAFALLKGRVLRDDGAFIPGASIHELGGARMGVDARTSVLNRFNQCWDSPNVFVTDGACFVTSGSQNPTLAIMAITARACAYAVDEFRRGAFG
jgi:choline dehydrogenase-like flavoprotein